MTRPVIPRWLAWAREIQALAQTGLTYAENEYEVERNRRLSALAAEIVAEHATLPQEELREAFLREPGYATPKVDIRTAAGRGGRLLMVRESTDGRWCFPGGWVDVGEVPSVAAARETREESGFEVEIRKVVGVYDANRSGRPENFFHAFKIVFLGEITGGEATPSFETTAVDFFAPGDLPPLSEERTHPRHVAEVLEHLRDPARPTAFD